MQENKKQKRRDGQEYAIQRKVGNLMDSAYELACFFGDHFDQSGRFVHTPSTGTAARAFKHAQEVFKVQGLDSMRIDQYIAGKLRADSTFHTFIMRISAMSGITERDAAYLAARVMSDLTRLVLPKLTRRVDHAN